MIPNYVIRAQYIDLVYRYEKEINKVIKIQMKYKFAEWLRLHQHELTDAEIEYLQDNICKVNLID